MAGKNVWFIVAALLVVSQAQADRIGDVTISEVVYPKAQKTSDASLVNLLSEDLTQFCRTGLTPYPCQTPDNYSGFYTFIFTFDQPYCLDAVHIWNFWNPDTGRTYDGARNIEISISPTADPADFGQPISFVLQRTNNGGWLPDKNQGGTTPELAYANSGLNVLNEVKGLEAMVVKLVILDCWDARMVDDRDASRHPGVAPEDFPVKEFHPFGTDRGTGLNGVAFFGTPVPEPVTMTLLALGGLALLRRR